MFAKPMTSLFLVFSLFVLSLPTVGYAQTGQATSAIAAAPTNYATSLAEIETKVEARRKELGIPGISLVIVKDDQIIFMKGLGYKDNENKVAVTPDTQFAIGLATKAFTALSVLMTADEGKLSLDDSPKKLLPYFKMYDPETDKNITIRDLMSHSSGLNRTDLAMITGKLTRAELIQVAAQAKPTAKLHEKFQYQNIMFTAAGEIVSQAQKEPWEKFVPERIFAPLGMTNSTMSIASMQKAKDYSLGYDYNFDTKATIKRPLRDIDAVAPAGSINSSARDMAQWLRFVMNGGTAGGKRLVSEANYAEWLKPQMKITPNGSVNYGFGWFLQKWNGLTVVQHGGNIDGFNSLVAMIPEKKLGFVLLTNVSASSLGADLMPIVWSNILEGPKTETTKLPLKTMQLLAAKYHSDERKADVEVKIEGEDLVLHVPGQSPYKLERTAPRTFKPVGLPDGFAAKFTPETGDAQELVLTQPGGVTSTLKRAGTDTAVKQPTADTGAAKTLVGAYVGASGAKVEIKESDGKVTFNIPGQQPYALAEKSKDAFSMAPLPDAYWLRPKRGDDGKLVSVIVTQPEGEFEFKRTGDLVAVAKPSITTDELHTKMVDAMGGEAAWRKITTRWSESDLDLENQGVQGKAISWSKAPNKGATGTTLTALGKTIATGWDYFDGKGGAELYSFSELDPYEGKRLDDVRLSADLYSLLDWKTPYKKVDITSTALVDGEDAYIVEFEPVAGTPFKEYYSTKSFLLLKREGIVPSSTSSQTLPYTITFSDYRTVDGIKLPFKTVNSSVSNGNIVTILKSVKHNLPVDDKIFAPKKLK